MFTVTLTVKNRAGELSSMIYLKSGDKFAAVQNVVAALALPNDEWATLVSVTVSALD